MSGPVKIVLVVFLALVVLAFSILWNLSGSAPAHPVAGPVVKVKTAGGHGSATHIGNGAFLTAAHVVAQGGEVTVLADDGTEHKAEVQWANKAYDVALLQVEGWETIRPVRLSCRVLQRDENVTAYGNPLQMVNIKTFGRVSGVVSAHGPWRSAIPINIAMAGGMSGGAIFDTEGFLVGIIVGVPIQQVGMGGSMIGIGLAVDGKSVCGLLARRA